MLVAHTYTWKELGKQQWNLASRKGEKKEGRDTKDTRGGGGRERGRETQIEAEGGRELSLQQLTLLSGRLVRLLYKLLYCS